MLTELSALLDLLKAKGVSRAHVVMPGTLGTVDVTFRDLGPPPIATPIAETEAPHGDSGTCRCGHSLTEHTNGLCLIGCDVEQCAPEEKQ